MSELATINADTELSTERVDLSDAAREFATQALAETTRRSYASHWKSWLDHCDVKGMTSFPASPEAVANWIAHRANDGARGGKRAKASGTGHAVGSLRCAVAAIKSIHSAKGVHFDASHPALSLVLKGIRRTKAEAPSQAAALRADLILEVLKRMGTTPLELRDACLLALGYAFARRRSELVGLDLDQVGKGDGFLTIDDRLITLTLFKHKTQSDEPLVVVVPRAGNGGLVKAIERWLAVADVRPGEPILRNVSRWGSVGRERLNDESVSRIIKSRIAEHFVQIGDTAAEARQKADRFSGHSLRVGFATSAAEAGADVRSIMTVTGHATPQMVIRYSKSADLERSSPYRLAGVGLAVVKDVEGEKP